jgi:hypothetical protein
MKRKVTLTITKIRRRTATAPAHFFRAHCADCGHEVELVNAAQAATALEITEASLATLSAGGQVHAFVTVNGQFKFCKDSLFILSQIAKG